MPVEIDVVYEGDQRCRVTHVASGQTLVTEAPPETTGQPAAFSPTDLLPAALGSCVATVMALVGERRGLDLKGTRVRVVKEMAETPVLRIGSLRVIVGLPPGRIFPLSELSRLERAAHACPVKQSLHPKIKITIEFRAAGSNS